MRLLSDFPLPVLYQQTSSEIINARVIVGAGSQQEAPGEDGVAHFLEHMFFKGTERRDYKEINAVGGRLGHVNAYTSFDRTIYHLTYLADDFEEGVELLFEMVFQPSFPVEELEKEIGVIIEERQSQHASPRSHFSHTLWANVLAADQWHNILGSEESLRSMTVDRLRAFRSRWYARNRMAVSVVGNVSEDRLSNALDAHMPNVAQSSHSGADLSLRLRDCEFHHASKQAIIALVAPGVSTNAEFASGQVPDVAADALGGGMHSLLFDRIREELGLCYQVSASHCSYAGLGLFEIYSMLDPANIGKAVDEMKAIAARVCRDGVSPELLDTAKRHHLFSWARSLEHSAGIGQCNDMFLSVTPENALAASDYAERKRRIAAISNERIIEFARQTFGENGENLRIISMTPD